MSSYTYKAKKDVETVEGLIEAENREQAISKLENMGYLPVTVEQAHAARGMKISRPKKISSRDINTFTRQLASLLKSKVQLVKGLDIIHRETDNPALKNIVGELRDEVKEGKSFSSALGKYPRYFSKIYVNMIASGERGGLLESILLRLVDFADREEEIRSKVRAALAYPLLMMTVGLATVFVMITFVMPRLVKLFKGMGQTLPVSTRVLIAVSDLFRHYWVWAALLAVIAVFAVKKLGLAARHIAVLEKMKLRIPLLKDFIIMREIARFCRTLSLLIGNGIPIRDAIDAVVPTLGNRVFERDLGAVSGDLASGLSMAKSLSKVPFFPGFVISIIGVGEEAGRLDEALLEVAISYEKQMDEQIKIISSLIEPLLILSIGLIVGFIVVSMLLPIFQISLR